MSIEHHPDAGIGMTGPGWPLTRPSGPEIELGIDPFPDRPQYNPAALLQDVAELLGRAGVATDLGGRQHTAVIAAADLLRALGVVPVGDTAPRRSRP